MQELSFSYVIIRSRRKTIGIRVLPDGSVQVLCSLYASALHIDAIVHSKANWIEKKLLEIKHQPPAIPFTDQELSDLTTLAKKELPPRIAFYAAQIGVSYGRITIRHQKTRWGSCSTKGNLNFNCLLMLTPPEVRDYIIVHELCHIKQMNHSFKFWAEVKKIVPDYREAKQWLKEKGPALIRKLPT